MKDKLYVLAENIAFFLDTIDDFWFDSLHTFYVWIVLTFLLSLFGDISSRLVLCYVWILYVPWFLGSALDCYLQDNFSRNLFVRKFMWYRKLMHDENAWEEDLELVWT